MAVQNTLRPVISNVYNNMLDKSRVNGTDWNAFSLCFITITPTGQSLTETVYLNFNSCFTNPATIKEQSDTE